MKALTNVLRVIVTEAPTEFGEVSDIEAMLEEKDGPQPGLRDDQGNVAFETRYAYEPSVRGPAIKWEKDGRYFVYVAWYGTKYGVRTRFRRLKVHLDGVPILAWDCEVVVAGRDAKGGPACASASVLSARSIEPVVPEG